MLILFVLPSFSLDKKQQVLRDSKVELEAAQSDLAVGRVTTSESRSKLPELAETLAFYMELREYVRDVIACFNEKMPKIEYLEKRSTILFRERADTLMARRRADVKDMADEVAYGKCGVERDYVKFESVR